MVIRSVNLDIVCGVTSRIPETSMPEFAFAGKSNVGKSTLINGLMNRKAYARTSAKPGKTQTINYYNINNEFYLVDLPGYGYATAGVDVKAKWGRMIEDYLYRSGSLRAVFLLLDARHEPSENDVLMFDWVCGAGFIPVVIATKADKLKRSQLAEHRKTLHDRLLTMSKYGDVADFDLIFWSGTTKDGREEIYDVIEQLIAAPMERRRLAGTDGNRKAAAEAASDKPEKASGNTTDGKAKNAGGKATGGREKKAAGKTGGRAKNTAGKSSGSSGKTMGSAAKSRDRRDPEKKSRTDAGRKTPGKKTGTAAGKRTGTAAGKRTGVTSGRRTGTSSGKKTNR